MTYTEKAMLQQQIEKNIKKISKKKFDSKQKVIISYVGNGGIEGCIMANNVKETYKDNFGNLLVHEYGIDGESFYQIKI